MMIFDFHTHISPDDDVDKLIEAMDQCGVDKSGASVVVAPGGDSGQAANRQLHQMIATHPDRLVGYAGVLPYAADGPGFLRYCFETYGFRALKLHPSIQQFYPDDRRIFPVVEEAIKLDIPILIHTGAVPIPGTASKYDSPIYIDDLALVYPEAKIVMAHADPFGDTPAIAAKHPNVYMDTTTTFARYARLIPGLAEETLRFMSLCQSESNTAYGCGKTLFGSDANPAKVFRIAENLQPLQQLNLPEDEKAMILGGNAIKLLKL
jgi:predicted TIM-barrel fold metal-dependent hydrolase